MIRKAGGGAFVPRSRGEKPGRPPPGAKEAAYMFICIDLKSFYASVECVDRGLDPLAAKLVVADETRTDKTICLAVSPALKALGVPGRPRLFEVYEKLREVKARTGEDVDFIIARPRMGLYVETSAKIYATYLKYVSPEDIHIYSIDEVFIDAAKYVKPLKVTARELAMAMIRDVLARTGITATAGLGTNLYLAKIAMDIVAKRAKPDREGVRIAELDELSYRRLLWDHRPITDFWMVAGGTAARLARLGVFTMGDLARLSLRDEGALFRTFGVDAEILIDHAWGEESCTMEDIKSYRPSDTSRSTGQVLSRPYTFGEARIIVREMAEELALDLTDRGLIAGAMVLHVGYDRENAAWGGAVRSDRYGRKVPVSAHGTQPLGSPTDALSRVVGAALELYDRIVNRELTVRRINLTAIRLSGAEERTEQLDMFSGHEREARESALQKAVLDIHRKYGKNALLKGHDFLEGATARERHGQIGGHRK